MKKGISFVLVGSLLLTGAGHVKADWIKDQQGKWEYFSNEDSISHLYDEKSKDFVKPVKLPQYYQADARWSSKRYGISNMKTTGCVPTSLSMIISGLKENVTPVQVADYIYDTSMADEYIVLRELLALELLRLLNIGVVTTVLLILKMI